MRKNTQLIAVFALLAAMALSSALSGCSFSVNKEWSAELSSEETAAPTARPATATASKTAAATPTEAPAAPTPTASPTPTAAPARTITQETVIHNVSSDGTISSETTFTSTASIQVGVVDGINYTSAAVPMPAGAELYVPTNLPQIGDAVQGADGLVVQVTGVETVDVDAENEFVVVDLIVGNAGKERQLISTDPCMEIVSGDGHWYSGFWYSLYWTGTGDDAYVLAMRQELHDNLLQHNLTSDFSAAIEPGQAAQGTAVFPVPKSAKQLAFGIQSWEATTYLFFANEANPTVFVPLGLRGDFPAIQANAATLDPKTTYKVGQSFKAPKRRAAFQVQSAWKRLESLGNMWLLEPGEQFVVVNVIAPAGTPLDQKRELAMVDGDGNSFELQEYASDWLTLRLGPFNQRGVLVFKGPRDATGLKLKFTPLDPATMAGDSPKALPDEVVTIDLGQIPAAPAVVVPTPAAQPTPTPTRAPSSGYELGDRVVTGGLAVTVSGWGTESGPEGFEAGAGNIWLEAYVTVENVGKADIYVDPESFVFVDQAGVVYNNLLNKPSSWDNIRDNVIEYTLLAPGGKLEDRILAIKIEEAAIPGLKVRYTAEDESNVVWELGL